MRKRIDSFFCLSFITIWILRPLRFSIHIDLLIHSWFNSEQIRRKKLIDFLSFAKEKWINNKGISNLLNIEQLKILKEQADNIPEVIRFEDYELLLKSSIKNKFDIKYWIVLEGKYLKSVDDSLRFKWICELIDDKEESSEEIKANAMALASRTGRPYIYFNHGFRKEKEARRIARRDGVTKGLICIFAVFSQWIFVISLNAIKVNMATIKLPAGIFSRLPTRPPIKPSPM